MQANKIKFTYPSHVTETFDDANFHIKYCLSFIKKYLKGDIAEIGAGCGSFTRNYLNDKITSLTLTEKDEKNIEILEKKFTGKEIVEVSKKSIFELEKKFDVILYLHVLEHIEEDQKEIEEATKKIKNNGFLIIMAPAHQKMFSNLDKNVGHYRRYEKEFFDTKFPFLERTEFRYLDSCGYILYKLNKAIFKKEDYPSKFKVFIWDKIFTPFSAVLDFVFRYRLGKCILSVFKKV